MIVSGETRGAEETLTILTRPAPLNDRRVHLIDTGFTGLLLRDLEKLEAFLREASK